MKVTGIVHYQVKVQCPHCKVTLDLAWAPYGVDDDYGHAEDLLGLAVFGINDVPAKWEKLDIEYTCCSCNGEFVLAGLEI